METHNLKKKSKKLKNLMLLTSLCAILSCSSGGGGGGTANNTPSNSDKSSNINTAPSKPMNPSKPNPGSPAVKAESGKAPETGAPESGKTPETGTPESGKTPETGTPESGKTPETGAPESGKTPETGTPESGKTPETGTPESGKTPETGTPESGKTPETGIPKPQLIPDIPTPGSAAKPNLEEILKKNQSKININNDVNPENKKITETMDGQNAIKSNFFGDNHGTIELTGKNTVGISSQIVYNRETGSIKVGESSIAQHAVYKDVVDYERFIINEGKIILGKDSTGIRMDKEYNNIDGFANNYGKIESNAENVTGIMAYIKDAKHPINNTNPISYIDNDGEINLSGDKSKGMYADGKGKMKMRNRNKIIIGNSFDKNNPSIAMHSINPENETINDGVIEVGKRSRGMSDANGGTLTNNGKIIVKGENGIGMYLANGSKGVNNGTIKTEPTAKNAIGVFIGKDSEFTNNGNIIINSEGGTGVLVDGGIVKNTGIFIIESNYSTGISSKGGKIISSGGYFVIKGSGSTGIIANGSPEISGTDFIIGGSGSTGKNILKAFTKAIPAKAFPAKRNLGIYVDSLGKTNPIEGLANLGLNSADLLIGAEATEKTNATKVTVGQDVLDPFNKSIKESNIPYWTVGSGSLIWEADPEIKGSRVEKVTLRKQSYTKFADEKTEEVAEGLDEKYVVASEKDKQIFNYMNTLRDAESLGKVYKEIDGSQYINVQQRINQTDNLLDKQISSLQKNNAGKAGHHVTTFFDRNKHDFRTDEVPDTTSAAFGASYLFNADSSWGVYGGVAINNYKFKDKGHSKESVSMLKAGGYKKFDLSIGDLDWTLGGDVFVSQNSMKRRIMTDKVYENKADYNAYGFSVKNEISKTYELGENSTIKPYGALKIGYGSFGKIKEKDATMGLDVKGNSYYSVKPSAGVELAYTKGITGNTRFKAALDLAYEHELGNAGRKKNQMKYINTNKTYRLKGEKAESRGNVRSGVKVGLETGNFNFSVNSGYDTKDKNAHVGLGIGASF